MTLAQTGEKNTETGEQRRKMSEIESGYSLVHNNLSQ